MKNDPLQEIKRIRDNIRLQISEAYDKQKELEGQIAALESTYAYLNPAVNEADKLINNPD
jgi:hypothetical protein